MTQLTDIDRHNPIPLYLQVASIIKSQIDDGMYGFGDRLPSETELVETYNISRTTARLTLNSLRQEGLVRRERGRGTIVVGKKIEIPLPQLLSFTEELKRLGYTPGTHLLELGREACPAEVAREFGLDTAVELLRVVRLRTADGRPLGVCASWLNTAAFPQLADQNYQCLSLYEIFEEDLKLPITRARQRIVADAASEREAELLRLPLRAPVLRVQRTTLVEGDRAIEIVDAAFNAMVYRYYCELSRERVAR